MSAPLEALKLHPLRIPMRHRFRRVEHRDVVLIEGPNGWGEFSPFPDYPTTITARWLAAALELACAALPEPGTNRVACNVTVPAVDPETAAGLVSASGATTAKVKIADPGDDETSDLARIEAVAAVLGPSGRIRVDVNASWDLETATTRLERLLPFNLEYVEQPVATVEDMKELRRRIPIPIAADEVFRQSPDPLRVIEEGAADVVVMKVQPMGGVSRVLDLASRCPVPVVISSALETSVGMYGGLLAGSLIDSPYAFGLGTVALLAGDPTPDPLLPSGGFLEVRRPIPDPELLEKWRPERDLVASLLRRTRAAAELLA